MGHIQSALDISKLIKLFSDHQLLSGQSITSVHELEDFSFKDIACPYRLISQARL